MGTAYDEWLQQKMALPPPCPSLSPALPSPVALCDLASKDSKGKTARKRRRVSPSHFSPVLAQAASASAAQLAIAGSRIVTPAVFDFPAPSPTVLVPAATAPASLSTVDAAAAGKATRADKAAPPRPAATATPVAEEVKAPSLALLKQMQAAGLPPPPLTPAVLAPAVLAPAVLAPAATTPAPPPTAAAAAAGKAAAEKAAPLPTAATATPVPREPPPRPSQIRDVVFGSARHSWQRPAAADTPSVLGGSAVRRRCVRCQKVFESGNKLHEHVRTAHPPPPPEGQRPKPPPGHPPQSPLPRPPPSPSPPPLPPPPPPPSVRPLPLPSPRMEPPPASPLPLPCPSAVLPWFMRPPAPPPYFPPPATAVAHPPPRLGKRSWARDGFAQPTARKVRKSRSGSLEVLNETVLVLVRSLAASQKLAAEAEASSLSLRARAAAALL